MNNLKKYLRSIVSPLTAIILSLIIGAAFISIVGKNPIEVYSRLFSGTMGSSYGIGQVLFKSTPLIFTGLAVAFAFKAGLFNIGAEGQVIVGAFCSALIGFTFINLPAYILLPLSILAGFIGGAFWGGIAGYLKAKYGSHEVINTIMLNFIAAALVSYFVNEIFNVQATVHTPEISPSAYIARFDSFTGLFGGSPFNLSFLIALLTCLIFYIVISKTTYGYEITTLGLNKQASEYAKMNVKRLIFSSMAISGGLAGLAGINFVNGYKHYFELGFSGGVGYIGIAVALIAKNNPVGVILVSILFGILEYGGLTVNTIVPKELVTMLQAIVIFFVIIISKILEKKKFKIALDA
jgi:ABC-type uncharacterized transport system permease subunit